MREFFEDRRLSGALNVKCKNDDGTFRMWSTRKEKVIQDIVDIVNEYSKMGLKLTLRQLHYQLVIANNIVNHQTAYKKLGVILDDCRYGGVIDWNAIEDRGRVPKLPYYALDPADAIRDIIGSYRLDRQDGQDVCVEVWTEKDALSGILTESTSEYHVRLCVNKGYTSSSAIYAAYNRFLDAMNADQKICVLYLGDHDPSGLDMVRDIYERIDFMFAHGRRSDDYDSDNFKVKQICLNMGQIRHYDLPPNPAKLTDTRAAAYISEFGTQSWEVDALRPDVLHDLVVDNILSIIDKDKYDSVIAQEVIDKEKLSSIKFEEDDE